MSGIVEKWNAFCEWQQRPYQVAQKSEEHHCCRTCGEEFQGNYCPRCGQSSKIGRYSFKAALLLFLDVWGMGNRGMFRTLRDLVLRPGYMIRDYISGMQMAYFPPFKLFFLLTALALVVDSGVNLKGENHLKTKTEQTDKAVGTIATEGAKKELTEVRQEERSFEEVGRQVDGMIAEYSEKYPNISSLLELVAMSFFIYLFVRKSPRIPDLRYSELLVALVYTANMYSIYSIVLKFFCAPKDVIWASSILFFIPLKQMTSFKWWKVILVMTASYLFITLVLLILLFVGYYILEL